MRMHQLPVHVGDNISLPLTDFNSGTLYFVIVTLAVCLCLGLPGPNLLQRFKYVSFLTLGLYFGAAILVIQFSHQWEVGEIEADVALSDNLFDSLIPSIENNSAVGLFLGLRGINVTFTNSGDDKHHGRFHFNEQFIWAWGQGKAGFGPFAGSFQTQLRAGQMKGFPSVILRVAHVFSVDGEGIRFGRTYHTAGWHCQSLIWSSFAFWIMSVLCLQFSLAPSFIFLGLSGLMLLLANLVWMTLSPALKNIPPTVLLGTAVLQSHLGFAFYLCLFTGALALILAAVLYAFAMQRPIKAASFFGLDPMDAYEECYCRADEVAEYVKEHAAIIPKSSIRRQLSSKTDSNDHEMYSLIPRPNEDGASSGATEKVLILRLRKSNIPQGFFSGRVRPRLSAEPPNRQTRPPDALPREVCRKPENIEI